VLGEVAALAVGRRARDGLHREGHALVGDPGGEAGVGHRAQVVGVRDEAPPHPGVEQRVEVPDAASAV
jgi:hypothetical protein